VVLMGVSPVVVNRAGGSLRLAAPTEGTFLNPDLYPDDEGTHRRAYPVNTAAPRGRPLMAPWRHGGLAAGKGSAYGTQAGVLRGRLQ